MSRSVLILHGWRGSGPDHWQTWLAQRLSAAGDGVRYPDLPECEVPCPDRWGAALRDELRALATGDDAERVVVCHSLACALWLREARHVAPELRVDRCLLVAPSCPAAGVPELIRFYPTGADRDAVAAAAATTRLVCSDDDPYCPVGAGAFFGEPLALPVDVLPGTGHINADSGFGPWPEVEEWVRGEREVLQAAGAKNGVET
jgi:predicted alpha/beta hydrolase family esterase